MSYGSNQGVRDEEDDYRERCAVLIAHYAAALVAARDMDRISAIKAATEWLRREIEAVGDVTGVTAIENEFPFPSKELSKSQVAAIASEMLDPARDATDTL
ncbi:hypothetical protein SAMN05414139_10769 [Burkholderia sp. D7]|nr:hypothetical protein SAMN05414139_10769 [Burkholderia sp. D7]